MNRIISSESKIICFMKFPSFRGTASALFTLAAMGFLVFYLSSRILVAVNAYRHAVVAYDENIEMHEHCISHDFIPKRMIDTCREARVVVNVKPIWAAFEAFTSQPCGTISCTDLIGNLLQKANGTIFHLTLALACIIFAWTSLSRFAAPLASNAVRHPIDRNHVTYIRSIKNDFDDEMDEDNQNETYRSIQYERTPTVRRLQF